MKISTLKKKWFIIFIAILLVSLASAWGYRILLAQKELDYKVSVAERGVAGVQYDFGKIGAQYDLGRMYLEGNSFKYYLIGAGVPQDYNKAVEWFKKAAEQGHSSAQFELGRMYAEGKGVPQDYSKAAEWHTKASEKGHAAAKYNLCIMHAEGKGVPQDYNKAAECMGSVLHYLIDYHHGRICFTRAIEWLEKTSEQGLAASQFELGQIYYNQICVTRDIQKGCSLMHAAAQQDGTFTETYNKLCVQQSQ
ncbi:MAG: sel1 repeat family protein [Alphaproteobacteria bacterium]|nr:sel1 repeat family protein [Alphaproteobacteria bacterium]MCL2505672.1 sel1 repeat family protein [Alphaproteobacteria bacterium]